MQADETVLSEVHVETCPPCAPGTVWSTRFLFSLSEGMNASQAIPHTSPEASRNASDSSDCCSEDSPPPPIDSDGDLVLTCRPGRKQHSITIHHSLATPISRCGEQVWQGACLLGDWVLANRQQLQGQVVVELGAGVGLVSILAGMFAAHVFLTDADVGALTLAQRNAAETPLTSPTAAGVGAAAAAGAGGQCAQASQAVGLEDIRVRVLDWLQLFDTQLHQLPRDAVLELLDRSSADIRVHDNTQPIRPQQQQGQQAEVDHLHQDEQQQDVPAAEFKWCPSDLQLLSQASIWLAADVVYDQTLTDTFMHTAAALMRWQQQQQQQPSKHAAHQHQQHSDPAQPPSAAGAAVLQPRLMVALEKRYNFTLRDMDAAAPAFDHFMSYLQPNETSLAAMAPYEQRRLRQQQQQQAQGRCLFQGERLDLDGVPQSLQYDRSSDYLELWELTLMV